jgi:hypothetical protein
VILTCFTRGTPILINANLSGDPREGCHREAGDCLIRSQFPHWVSYRWSFYITKL